MTDRDGFRVPITRDLLPLWDVFVCPYCDCRFYVMNGRALADQPAIMAHVAACRLASDVLRGAEAGDT